MIPLKQLSPGTANCSPRRGILVLLCVCPPHRLRAHLTGLFQIQRGLIFVMGLLVLGVEARHAYHISKQANHIKIK